MKRTKNEVMSVAVLVMMVIWGFVIYYKKGFIPTGLDLFIFVMIVVQLCALSWRTRDWADELWYPAIRSSGWQDHGLAGEIATIEQQYAPGFAHGR